MTPSGMTAHLGAAAVVPLVEHREVRLAGAATLSGSTTGDFMAGPVSGPPGMFSSPAELITVSTVGRVPLLGGRVKVFGTIYDYEAPGASPTGQLQVKTGRGNLSLQIPSSASSQAALPAPTQPNELFVTFRISRSTGAFKHATGSGVVELQFTPMYGPDANGNQSGKVRLTLSPLTTG